jgi:hypothetical protein
MGGVRSSGDAKTWGVRFFTRDGFQSLIWNDACVGWLI